MPLLAMVAAATERLRVGTFVLNVCLRHPAVLAQDLATLDALSGGRLEIGLGAGWNKPEHDAIGNLARIPEPPLPWLLGVARNLLRKQRGRAGDVGCSPTGSPRSPARLIRSRGMRGSTWWNER